jgi:hypothetical protein
VKYHCLDLRLVPAHLNADFVLPLRRGYLPDYICGPIHIPRPPLKVSESQPWGLDHNRNILICGNEARENVYPILGAGQRQHNPTTVRQWYIG